MLWPLGMCPYAYHTWALYMLYMCLQYEHIVYVIVCACYYSVCYMQCLSSLVIQTFKPSLGGLSQLWSAAQENNFKSIQSLLSPFITVQDNQQ